MINHDVIPKLLISAIKANTVLVASLAGRVHYQFIPQSSEYPHVYVARTGRESESFLDGDNGTVEDRFIVEFVAPEFDGDSLNALYSSLSSLEGQLADGTWLYCVDVLDVDDNYLFRSADPDGLFVHAFQVTVYHS